MAARQNLRPRRFCPDMATLPKVRFKSKRLLQQMSRSAAQRPPWLLWARSPHEWMVTPTKPRPGRNRARSDQGTKGGQLHLHLRTTSTSTHPTAHMLVTEPTALTAQAVTVPNLNQPVDRVTNQDPDKWAFQVERAYKID